MIDIANRLANVEEYYFSKKLQEIAQLNAAGKNIINLGIGSPDLAPHTSVIDCLYQYAQKNNTHAYQSYRGLPELRNAMCNWYATYYNTKLDTNTEVLPLIGSKEGIVHICMTYLNEGDIALVPNPGYPTYASAIQLAGGKIVNYNLTEENSWEPNFAEIENSIDINKVKLWFVNYPHMPTGKAASKALYTAIIAFAKKHDILVINDNPYSFIGNNTPLSILSIKHAKNHAIELNSLSKCLNMAGWRIGMLCGNAQHINNIIRFKSNMDSGMFLPLQMAAATALNLDSSWYTQLNNIYNERRIVANEIAKAIDCTVTDNQQGLFVWAKINNIKNSNQLCDQVLYDKNVFITPGAIFGSNGDKYMRISLCQPKPILETALTQIKNDN